MVRSCLDVATSAASLPAAPALSSAPHTAFTLFYGKFRAAAPRLARTRRNPRFKDPNNNENMPEI